MRRTARTTFALGCAVVLLTGAAPASATAPPTVASPRASVASLASSDDARVSASTTRTRVSTSSANTRISQVLRTRSTSKILGKRFTMTVWDTASGSYVYQRRAGSSLRGASTTKILTTVGVLATLGPDHRFPTTVRAGATPDEVVLVAGGDPLLSSADLRTLAALTKDALGLIPPPDPAVPPVPADPAPTRDSRHHIRGAHPGRPGPRPHDHGPRRRLPLLRLGAITGVAQLLPAQPGAPGGRLRPR